MARRFALGVPGEFLPGLRSFGWNLLKVSEHGALMRGEVIVSLLPDVINSIGLSLAIAGVILLFLYGLPDDVRKDGMDYFGWGKNKEEVEKWKRYKKKILPGARSSCYWLFASTR